MIYKDENENESNENESRQKIESLRDMISTAEKTIQSAKAMLLQIEGKKKTGRKRKVEEVDGNVVQGTFEGQIMIGTDGKQYPVLANYASKSKLVEGDLLKLTITPDGSFIYKQIGPAERKNAIGIVSQDEAGNFYVLAEGKPYKVLLASITYFKADPGDEVAIVLPRFKESTWAAIENVVNKGHHSFLQKTPPVSSFQHMIKDSAPHSSDSSSDIVDEWTADIEKIKEELKKSQTS